MTMILAQCDAVSSQSITFEIVIWHFSILARLP
jgi:hypothetical protein